MWNVKDLEWSRQLKEYQVFQWSFDQDPKVIQWRKNCLFNQWCWNNCSLYWGRLPKPLPCLKISLERLTELSIYLFSWLRFITVKGYKGKAAEARDTGWALEKTRCSLLRGLSKWACTGCTSFLRQMSCDNTCKISYSGILLQTWHPRLLLGAGHVGIFA